MLEISELSPEKIATAKKNIGENLSQFQKGRVLIVGDLCLDEYLIGEAKRISPEAPVPVVDVQKHERRLGLAAFVAENVVSLGGHCQLVGVVGNDSTGEELAELLRKSKVIKADLVVDNGRPTTRKTRIIADNHHIARVDFERRQFLSEQIESELVAKVSAYLAAADVVVLQDYGKGVFSKESCQKIIKVAKQQGKPVLVDPHRTTPVDYYSGVDLLKPNRDEAFILSGLNIDDLRENKGSLAQVAGALRNKVQCKNLIITLGREGMLLFAEGGGFGLPTQAKQIFDVTGAGDTVLATLALAWASGFSLEESCVAANSAAGLAVGKIGCQPCSAEELKQALVSLDN